MERGRYLGILALVAVMGLFFASNADAFTMDWVTVGDAGNVADKRYDPTGYGSVADEYRIGKYEVTNSQYCDFLNVVAVTGDTHGLYNTSMGSGYGGITRSGSGIEGDLYNYVPRDTNWGSKPVNYVSWYDTLRFANWLHNGQPTGEQTPSTTEDGAYDMTLGSSVVRKGEALVWLPSEDEWYKAAYYDGNTGTYYNYATGSDSVPDNKPPSEDTGNSANYYNNGYAVGEPYYVTDVGAYGNSESPYGTFDQNGNLWEWNEALIYGSWRVLRGGSWGYSAGSLQASHRSYNYPTGEYGDLVGFRVASPEGVVPEPGTILLLGSGLLGLLGFKKKRKV